MWMNVSVNQCEDNMFGILNQDKAFTGKFIYMGYY